MASYDPFGLIRWEPFEESTPLRDAMNRLLETSFVRPTGGGGQAGMPAVDLSENENEYVVKASLPGMKAEDVQISIQNDVLTIAGERREDEERKEGERTIYREHRYGSFSRSFSLPSSVNADACNAEFKDGVLRLTLPKAESAKPRRIQVRGAEGAEAIEGQQVQRQQVGAPSGAQESSETRSAT